jgi:hypothetical protein
MHAKGDKVQKTSDRQRRVVLVPRHRSAAPARPADRADRRRCSDRGAGLTGLWPAYYLAKAVPELSVAILEKEFAGSARPDATAVG